MTPISDPRRASYVRLLASALGATYSSPRIYLPAAPAARPHARLRLERRDGTILVLGANAGEDQETIEGAIGAGLVWVDDFNRRRDDRRRARELWICLPAGSARTAVERVSLLDVSSLVSRLRCFEVDEERGALSPAPTPTSEELFGAPPARLLWPPRQPQPGRWRERILALAPDLIEARCNPGGPGERYSIRGLEFARAEGTGQCDTFFGPPGKPWMALARDNFIRLEQIVEEIIEWRRAEAPDRRHPFYRLRPEAWLESLLRREIGALDPRLDPRFVYSQVPAWRLDSRAVIDLLAIDRAGRLAVIEVKASEDAGLPLQGLDYWLRIEGARRRQELAGRGLFAGLELSDQPPRLYLVAPRLRFHRSFAAVAGCLSPNIEAWRVGVNLDWRAGLRIHCRERIN
jgi:hypothetical protein